MDDDSPRRDDELSEILRRLIALEQRLASLEQWAALPAGMRSRTHVGPQPPT